MGTILVVGAGLAGCVMSRLLAEQGYIVHLIEMSKHIGGICRDVRDEEHNCYKHMFGPHIFHTDNKRVWDFINRFTTMKEYRLQQKSFSDGKVYDWPLNLNSLEMYYDIPALTPERAKRLMKLDKSNPTPQNFEDACIRDVGEDLYKKFFHGYTLNQWRRDPKTLPVSFYKRCPIRFDRNPVLFSDQYQGLPDRGYTEMMRRMIEHENIFLSVETSFSSYLEQVDPSSFDKIIYTGGFKGLPYRSTLFLTVHESSALQYPVLSLPDHICFTRKTNFTVLHPIDPIRMVEKQCICYELPQEDNFFNQLLPIPTKENLEKYDEVSREFLQKFKNIVLVGRLATYQYLDMDEVVEQCIALVDTLKI